MSSTEQSLYGGGNAAAKERKPVTLHRLREMQAAGEPITMLTCYDASFAKLLDAAGVDTLLIGDSLGMVLQGRSSTLPVTLEETAYHIRSVQAGNATPSCWATCPSAATRNRKSRQCAAPPC